MNDKEKDVPYSEHLALKKEFQRLLEYVAYLEENYLWEPIENCEAEGLGTILLPPGYEVCRRFSPFPEDVTRKEPLPELEF